MKQRVRAVYFGIIALILVSGLASITALAKSDKANDTQEKSKTKKSTESTLKSYEKADKNKGETNASVYRENIAEISNELKQAAQEEKNKGQQNKIENTVENKINNPSAGAEKAAKVKTREEVAEELEVVATETENNQEETIAAIEKAEKEGGFKKFLVGTSYKNLGQLRSSLVHNRNQIRKLIALSESTADEAVKATINEQILTLTQERERIKTILSENEEGFSLLGWVFKFLNGYPKEPISEEEEDALTDEVVAVIEENNDTENTVETVPTQTVEENNTEVTTETPTETPTETQGEN